MGFIEMIRGIKIKILPSSKYAKNIVPGNSMYPKSLDDYITENLLSEFIQISKCYFLIINCLLDKKENEIKELKKTNKDFINNQSKKWKLLENNILYSKEMKLSHIPQKTDSVLRLNELVKSLIKTTKKHISQGENFISMQKEDLNILLEEFSAYMNYAIHQIHSAQNIGFAGAEEKYSSLANEIEKLKKRTIKQVKKGEITVNNSLYFLQLVSDTENIAFHIRKILTAQK